MKRQKEIEKKQGKHRLLCLPCLYYKPAGIKLLFCFRMALCTGCRCRFRAACLIGLLMTIFAVYMYGIGMIRHLFLR
jgi:hypothetical protein